MTFRVLDSREAVRFFDECASTLPNLRETDNLHAAGATRMGQLRAQLRTRTNSDGDCLRGLSVALGIEASAVALVLGVWALVQMVR